MQWLLDLTPDEWNAVRLSIRVATVAVISRSRIVSVPHGWASRLAALRVGWTSLGDKRFEFETIEVWTLGDDGRFVRVRGYYDPPAEVDAYFQMPS